MKNLLAVCYGAGHVNMVLPVLKELRRRNQYEITVLGLTTAFQPLSDAGFNPLRIMDLVEPDLDASALRLGQRLAMDLPSGGPVPLAESRAYLGISYQELVEDAGPEAAADLYEEKGRAAFLPVRFARRTIERLSPDVLLTTNSPRMERAFLQAADELGVSNAVIWPSLADSEAAWVGRPRKNAIVCVDNEFALQRLKAVGATDSMLRMTGGPQYADLFEAEIAERAAAYRAREGWGDRFVLLWASQLHWQTHPITGELADPDLPRKIALELDRLVANRADRVALSIRFHPNEPVADLPLSSATRVNRRDDDLRVVLNAIDAVFTINSSITYQAALIGKPVLQFMDSPYAQATPFEAMGLVTAVDSFDDMEEAIDGLAYLRLPAVNLLSGEGAPAKIADLIQELK